MRFVFDRSGGRAALVRFEGDPEVHVLRPYMAAGGGEIYRTEDGGVMLRVTPHGGIIVYTRTMRTGSPASEEESVAPLTPAAIAFAEMQERFRQLQARARRSLGQSGTFTAPAQVSAPAAGVVVDAAERAAEGLAAAPMTSVRRVTIVFGPAPAVVSSFGHTNAYQHVVEEVLVSDSRQGGMVNPLVRADMVYFSYPDGGAVFSTGSIAWCGALSFNAYNNNVSRIMENVLRRFVSDEPLP